MDPHCFDADPDPDPDPAQNLDADPDPDPGGREGVGQPKMCIPPGKILGTPLDPTVLLSKSVLIPFALVGDEVGHYRYDFKFYTRRKMQESNLRV